LGRYKPLFAEGLVARAEFEGKQEQVTWAANELAEAQRKLGALLNSVRPQQIEEAKAQIERLEAQGRYLKEQLRLMTLVSPVAGVVATPSRQLQELPGQLVRKGDLVAKVYEMDTIVAQLVVSEKDIADIRVGQGVALKVRAYPDDTFQGKVTDIATSAEANPLEPPAAGRAVNTDKTVLVTTEIDNHSHLLKPEMTGQAKIFCGRRSGPELFMRRLARTFKVEFWGWW
jgi:multidrug resistance efflux pump